MIAPYSPPHLAPVHLIGCKECSLIGNTAFKLLTTELTPPKIWSERIGPPWGRASNQPTLASLTTNCLTCLACYLPLACFAYFVFSTWTWTLLCSQKIWTKNSAKSNAQTNNTRHFSRHFASDQNCWSVFLHNKFRLSKSNKRSPFLGVKQKCSAPDIAVVKNTLQFVFFLLKNIQSKFFQRVARSGSICRIWDPNAY